MRIRFAVPLCNRAERRALIVMPVSAFEVHVTEHLASISRGRRSPRQLRAKRSASVDFPVVNVRRIEKFCWPAHSWLGSNY